MGRGGIIIMQCSTNVVDLDTNKCVLLPSHDEESNHCCDDQVTIESKCNVGDLNIIVHCHPHNFGWGNH